MVFHLLKRAWKGIMRFYNDRFGFLHIHHIYILALILITSALFYTQPATNWNYIDALFMATSIATNTGLSTIDMSTLSHWQLAIIYLSSMCGSHILISIAIVLVRKYYFSKRFEDVLQFNKERRVREINRRKFEKDMAERPRIDINRQLSCLSADISTNMCRNEEDNQKTYPGASMFHFKPPRPLSIKRKSQTSNPPHSVTLYDPPMLNSKIGKDECLVNAPEQAHVKNVKDLGISTTSNVRNSYFQFDRRSSSSTLVASSSTLSSEANSENGSTLKLHRSSTIDVIPSIKDLIVEEEEKTPVSPSSIVFANNINVQRKNARRQFIATKRRDDIESQVLLALVQQQDKDMERIMGEPVEKEELTREQRLRLGGEEYGALDFLARLVFAYYIFFTIGFGLVLRIYVALSTYAQEVLQTSNANGPVNPWVFSFFTSLASFNNLGLIPLSENMVPFQSAPFMIFANIILILAGNTAYALFLRLIIWSIYKLTSKKDVMKRETFKYLLDHPRRCYTTLFPASHTRWLTVILIVITVAEFLAFISLNYSLPVFEKLDLGARIMDGLFQSVATRSAGYSIVDLMNISPAIQVIFVVAMYISVYPVAISMRNSNVYQERDLGVYYDDDDELEYGRVHRLKRQLTITSFATTIGNLTRKADLYIKAQIQRQLTSEISWVLASIFLICAFETQTIMNNNSPVTIASIIFECVSAFGNVGASMGYPKAVTSQASQYGPVSKLILILLMYRGRHRGLPDSIDRAVLLPSDDDKMIE